MSVSRDSYVESNKYLKVIQQQGQPIVDYDINEAQDIIRGLIGDVVKATTGDGIGNGFKVEEADDNTNNFKVTSGIGYKGGDRAKIENNTTANDENLDISTPENDREDLVYLDIYTTEITKEEDSNIIHSKLDDAGLEPSTRLQEKVDIKIQEDDTNLPNDDEDHKYIELAIIHREGGRDSILEEDIEDTRQLIGSQYENSVFYGEDEGSENNYEVTIPGITQYQNGLKIIIKTSSTNTGSASIKINKLDAIDLKRENGDDMQEDDIKENELIYAVYYDDEFKMLNKTGEMIDDRVSELLQEGDNINIIYDDEQDEITIETENDVNFDNINVSSDIELEGTIYEQDLELMPVDGSKDFEGDVNLSGGGRIITGTEGDLQLESTNDNILIAHDNTNGVQIGQEGEDQDIDIYGTTTIDGAVTMEGNVNITEDVDVEGDIYGGQTLNLGTEFEISYNSDEDSLDINNLSSGGIVTIDTDLEISGNTTIDGTTDISSDIDITGSGYISDNLTIGGNLTVEGDSFEIETETVEAEDNLIVINSGETGTGVTAGEAGIEIDRGDGDNYKFIFEEDDDNFQVGLEDELQPVATREDSPTSEGIPYWDNSEYRFITDSGFTFDPSASSPLNLEHDFNIDGGRIRLQSDTQGDTYINSGGNNDFSFADDGNTVFKSYDGDGYSDKLEITDSVISITNADFETEDAEIDGDLTVTGDFITDGKAEIGENADIEGDADIGGNINMGEYTIGYDDEQHSLYIEVV